MSCCSRLNLEATRKFTLGIRLAGSFFGSTWWLAAPAGELAAFQVDF